MPLCKRDKMVFSHLRNRRDVEKFRVNMKSPERLVCVYAKPDVLHLNMLSLTVLENQSGICAVKILYA